MRVRSRPDHTVGLSRFKSCTWMQLLAACCALSGRRCLEAAADAADLAHSTPNCRRRRRTRSEAPSGDPPFALDSCRHHVLLFIAARCARPDAARRAARP